jgi:hypothetical protein
MASQADIPNFKRDQHLFGPGPKRLLALDGGGVRGAITVAFLAEMQELLRKQDGPQAMLGDWFDLIGGTSTGAIIAGALALGHSTQEVEDFYRNRAHIVFKHSWGIPGVRSRFDAKALSAEIERVVGKATLDSPELITGFALVTKRVDTGSPWVVSNNPRALFWDAKPDDSYIANRKYRLANLVRASTAAPFYFDPELISIHTDQESGLFIDGGVTPHNNPSLILYLMATLKAYGIGWKTGEDNLTVVSVGTGSYRRKLLKADLGPLAPLTLAVHALSALVDDNQTEVLTLMQLFGKSLTPWSINSELGTLADEDHSAAKFKFVRYDVRLEREWLEANFDQKLSDTDIRALREIDRADYVPLAYEIGRQAAQKQVKPEHFGLAPMKPETSPAPA